MTLYGASAPGPLRFSLARRRILEQISGSHQRPELTKLQLDRRASKFFYLEFVSQGQARKIGAYFVRGV